MPSRGGVEGRGNSASQTWLVRGPCVVVVVIGFDCKEAIPPRRRKVIDEARRRAGLPVEDWSRQGVGATLMLGLVVVPSWEFKATENDVI